MRLVSVIVVYHINIYYFIMNETSIKELNGSIDPNIEVAKKHGEEYILLNREGNPIPVCSSTPSDLGSGGLGLELYFVFLKQMILMFTIMTVFAIPVVIVNYLGGYLNDIEKTSPFEGSTIANQQGTLPDLRDNVISKSDRAYMYVTVFMDVAYCVAFVVVLALFECYNKKRINRSKNVNVSDFAVMIELAEGITSTEEELKGFFEKYGPIHECIIPKYYGRALKRYLTYMDLEKKLIVELKNPEGENARLVDAIREKRKEILEDIKSNPDSDDGKLKAFIIFETLRSKQECLKDYSKRWLVRTSEAHSRRIKFKSTPSKVNPAPEPIEIFWEKFGEKRYKWKTAIIYVVLAFTLLISLLIISIVEYYENRLPTYSMCIKEDYIRVEGGRNGTEGLEPENESHVLCFCGGLEEKEIKKNESYKSFCANYWNYFVGIWILRFLGMGAVSLVNTLLKYTIMWLIKLDTYVDNTSEEHAKFRMLSIFQTINMCGIIFIANLDLSYLSAFKYIHEHFPGGKYLFNGLHPNFTRFWYIKVGMSIFILKAVGIIWPQILNILFMVPICALKRAVFGPRQKFQKDMNRCYEKLNTNLWDRYASGISNTFFTLMFCAGIPLLIPFHALFFLSMYWIDKATCKYESNGSCEVLEKAAAVQRTDAPTDVQGAATGVGVPLVLLDLRVHHPANLPRRRTLQQQLRKHPQPNTLPLRHPVLHRQRPHSLCCPPETHC